MMFWWSYQKLVDQVLHNKMDLDDFEKINFIPELKSRLDHYESELRWMQHKCKEADTLDRIEPAFRLVQQKHGLNGSGRDAALKYLTEINIHIQNQILNHIHSAQEAHSKIHDALSLNQFIQKLMTVLRMLENMKGELVGWRLQFHFIIRDTQTDTIISNEHPEYDGVAVPFRTRLETMAVSALASIQSIEEWRKQKIEQKTTRLNFLVQNSAVIAANRNIWAQFLTIVLAVVLSFFFMTISDPLNLLKENRGHEEEVKELTNQNLELRKELSKAKQALLDLKPPNVAPK